MGERRKYQRSQTERNGQYFLDGREGGFGGCTITNVSREGMGIRFHTDGKMNIDSTILLKITVPPVPKFVNVRGILKWIEEKEDHFLGGIELHYIDRGERSLK